MDVIPLSETLTALYFRAGSTSCLAISMDHHLPVIVHWGDDLGDLGPEGIGAAVQATRQHVVGNPGDALMQVSVLPEQAQGWLGTPGVQGSRQGQGFSTNFVVSSITSCEPTNAWPHRCLITASDEAIGLGLDIEMEQSASGLMRQRAKLTNNRETYHLDAMTLLYPVPNEAGLLMDFTGYWAKERIPQSRAFTHGTHLRESRCGRPGFGSAFMLMAADRFANRTGCVWATHVGWSGNHRALAEKTVHSINLIGGGELFEPGEICLAPSQSYSSPWVYGAYSGQGLDGVSDQFHSTIRADASHPVRPRPVTLNSWQAVYFHQEFDSLATLARTAAEVGVERFVVDDGWFSGRRDATTSLGDWWVSPDVWPNGLGQLIDLVDSLGMEFGLWFEPEMISLNSQLAVAHPEWISSLPERLPLAHRDQQVLNLAIPEAYNYILTSMNAILDQYKIAYIKWDHNRDLIEAADRTTGRPIVHEQTLAAYRLMDELKASHAGLEIESCASGGARVDLGVLNHVDRFWVSDDIDALERQSINRWTNLLVPFEMMGTHVEDQVSHSTRRHLTLAFRAAQAMFGHFGIEWDITSLDQASKAELTRWIDVYKQVRDLIATGRSVHADVPEGSPLLHGVVSPDGRDALYAWTACQTSLSVRHGPVRLPGLDESSIYRVRVQEPSQPDSPAMWGGPVAWLSPDGIVAPGSVLARAGLAMPTMLPAQSLLLRATAI